MPELKREVLFSAGDDSIRAVRAWWGALERDRGGRAELRRARNGSEVVFSPTYHQLVRRFAGLDRPYSREKLAAVAVLVARIKIDTGEGASFPAQVAAGRPGGGGAVVSGLRFRRLLAAADLDDLVPLLVRSLSLLAGSANLVDLTRSVYWWNEATKRRWAYEYYAAAPSEP